MNILRIINCIWIVPILVILSCSKVSHGGKVVHVNPKQTIDITNNQIIGELLAVSPLETKPESILSGPHLIDIIDFNDRILILDRGQKKLFHFELTGKFVKCRGIQGKGPGECSYPSKMVLLDNQHIGIMDRGRRVLIYNKDLNWVKDISFDKRYYGIESIADDSLVFINQIVSKNMVRSVAVLYNWKTEEVLLKNQISDNYKVSLMSRTPLPLSYLFKINRMVYFSNFPYNNLFSLDSNLQPNYTFGILIGESMVTIEEYANSNYSAINSKGSVRSLFPISNSLVVSYTYKGRYEWVYQLETDSFSELFYNKDYHLRQWYDREFDAPVGYINNTKVGKTIGVVMPQDLLANQKHSLRKLINSFDSYEIEDRLTSIHESSNPIVLIYDNN